MSSDALSVALESEKATKAVADAYDEIKKDSEKAMASSKDLGTSLDNMAQKLNTTTASATSKVTALITEQNAVVNENRLLRERVESLTKTLEEHQENLRVAHETIKALTKDIDAANLRIMTNSTNYAEQLNTLLEQIESQKVLLEQQNKGMVELAKKHCPTPNSTDESSAN